MYDAVAQSGYSYRLSFDSAYRPVRVGDRTTAADVIVSVDPKGPTTITVYSVLEKAPQLTATIERDIWEHNTREHGPRRVMELAQATVRALAEKNGSLVTPALRRAVLDKGANGAGWKVPESIQHSPQTSGQQLVLTKAAPAASQPDRLADVLERFAQLANRPIEVNVTPPSVTISEGAVQVAINNTHPKPGDLEISFPDGRKTKVKRV